MDTSGFGMMFVSCCFMVLIPPIITGMAYLVVYVVCKIQGIMLNQERDTKILVALYVLSAIASCLVIWFFYLRNMYIM